MFRVDTYPFLIEQGIYNELSHFIQQWRKTLKVDLLDKISIYAYIKDNQVELTLHATKQNEHSAYGVDHKIKDINEFSVLNDRNYNDFFLFAKGLKYISDKIHLHSFSVYYNGLEIKYIRNANNDAVL